MVDLDKKERKTVSHLGGILRLADGLDRSRSQRVRSVTASRDGDIVNVLIAGDGALGVETHGAAQKADLMERAFDIRVDITRA